MIARVVSGGQTGVDRAALDVVLRLGVPCGGWCPRGRLAEDGPLSLIYPLDETPTSEYAERTEWNVRDSDGTLILGIETSCDETAVAVVEADPGRAPVGRILSNVVYSQLTEHRRFGGVVPEIAARAHLERIDGLVTEALAEAGLGLSDLDAGDLKYHTDFRAVYATLLNKVLEWPAEQILGGNFPLLEFV